MNSGPSPDAMSGTFAEGRSTIRTAEFLGEIRQRSRLIIDTGKLARRQLPFFPLPPRPGAGPRAPVAALILPPDHLDFLPP